MDWRTRILITLALSGLLVAQTPEAAGWNAPELAAKVKDHINERMYNTCKAVVLRRETAALYTGHAEFLNGVKVDLEVSVSDQRVEYTFVKPQPEPAGVESTQTQIEQLQAIITRQELDIARLRDLCAHAGIDIDAIETNAVLIPPEQTDPLGEPLEPETMEPVAEEQAIPEPEAVWFTRPSYDDIAKGMTSDRVAKKLGAEGKLISNSDFDRAINEVYIWANPDDSHACVVFRNGKVLVKTQFGLPSAAPSPQPPVLDTP